MREDVHRAGLVGGGASDPRVSASRIWSTVPALPMTLPNWTPLIPDERRFPVSLTSSRWARRRPQDNTPADAVQTVGRRVLYRILAEVEWCG